MTAMMILRIQKRSKEVAMKYLTSYRINRKENLNLSKYLERKCVCSITKRIIDFIRINIIIILAISYQSTIEARYHNALSFSTSSSTFRFFIISFEYQMYIPLGCVNVSVLQILISHKMF